MLATIFGGLPAFEGEEIKQVWRGRDRLPA